eukprot:PhF_6_TR41967/c0_g1_i1/m.63486
MLLNSQTNRFGMNIASKYDIQFPLNKNAEPGTFSRNPSLLKEFGPWKSGDVVTCTTGKDEGLKCLIIGVRNGFLWRKREDCYGATAFSAWDAQDLEKKYGLVKIGEDEVSSFLARPREGIKGVLAQEAEIQKAVEKHPYRYPVGIEQSLKVFDIHISVLEPFGVKFENRVLLHSGNTAVIVGVLGGQLWIHDEQHFFPTTCVPAQIRAVVGTTTLRSQEIHSVVYAYRELTIADTHLKNMFGYLHGSRILKTKGPRQGMIGTVVGSYGSILYETSDTDPYTIQPLGSCRKEIDDEHGPIVIGLRCGRLRTPPAPTLYQFPCSGTTRLFDIRTSQCLKYGDNCCHGMAVRIVYGPLHGTVARVVGVRDEGLWVVTSWEAGAFKLEPGTYHNTNRAAEPLLVFPPPTSSFRMPAFFGDVIELDTSPEACSTFRLYSGQHLVLGPQNGTVQPSLLSLNEEMPEGYCRCTVIGVYRGELWIRKHGDLFATNLFGTCSDTLRMHYKWDVKGYSESLHGTPDPFLGENQKVCISFSEKPFRDLPGCVQVQNVYLNASKEAFQRVECPQLEYNCVVEWKQTKPIPRITSRLILGAKETSFVHETVEYLTVLGVCGENIYFFQENEEIVIHLAQRCKHCSRLPEEQIPLQIREQRRKRRGENDTSMQLYSPPNAVRIDTLIKPRTAFTENQFKQMLLKFSLLPQACLLEIFRWVLTFYGIRLSSWEDKEDALRKLLTLEVAHGLFITPPNYEQWCFRNLEILGEDETLRRRDIEFEWSELNLIIIKKGRDLRRNHDLDLEVDEGAPHEPMVVHHRRRSIPELVRIALNMDHTLVEGDDERSDTSSVVEEELHFTHLMESNMIHRRGSRRNDSCRVVPHISQELLDTLLASVKKPFIYWQQGIPEIFDIDDEVLAPFGFQHGDRIQYNAGDVKRTIAVIVGVKNNRLWRYHENENILYAFAGQNIAEITSRYAPINKGKETNVRQSDFFEFHTNSGEWVEFDPTHEVMKLAGLAHGERYQVTKGIFTGRQIVIIGYANEFIWYAVDWSGAHAFMESPGDWKEVWGLRFLYMSTVRNILTQPKRTAMLFTTGDITECYDISFETCRPFGCLPGQRIRHVRSRESFSVGTVIGVKNGRMHHTSSNRVVVPIEASPQELSESSMDLISWTQPPYKELVLERRERRTIKFLSALGHVCVFDISDASCYSNFGLQHGDCVVMTSKLNRGLHFEATILGVRDGYLWKVDRGEQIASLIHGCRNNDDIQRLWTVMITGKGLVEECTG